MNLKLLVLSFSLFGLSFSAFANNPPPNTVQCSPVSKAESAQSNVYQIDCVNSPSDAFYCSIGNALPQDNVFFAIFTGQQVAQQSGFSSHVEFINSVSLLPSPAGTEMHFLLQVMTDSPNVSITCAAGDDGRRSY